MTPRTKTNASSRRAATAYLLSAVLGASSAGADEVRYTSPQALFRASEAEFLLASGDAGGAAAALEQALVSDPAAGGLVVRLLEVADAYRLEVAWDRWSALLLRLEPARARSWLWRARALEHEGRTAEVARALSAALGRDLGSTPWAAAAQAWVSTLQVAAQAEEVDRWLARHAHRHPAVRALAVERAWRTGSPGRALALVSRDPPSWLRVVALDRAGEVGQAAAEANTLAAGSSTAGASRTRALELARRAGPPSSGSFPSVAPSQALSATTAWILDRARQRTVALTSDEERRIRSAWGEAPDEAIRVVGLALLLEQRGGVEDARRQYRRALGLEPTCVDAWLGAAALGDPLAIQVLRSSSARASGDVPVPARASPRRRVGRP